MQIPIYRKLSLNYQPTALKKLWIILRFGNWLFVILENAGNTYENISKVQFCKKNSVEIVGCFFLINRCKGTVHYGSSAPMAPPVEELILCPVITCFSCVLLTPHFYPILCTSSEHWLTILTNTVWYSCRNLTWRSRGDYSIIRKHYLSNLRNRMKPQGWKLGWISQMGRSGIGFWGKNSSFRWVLVTMCIYNVQLNQLLRPWSWCVIKEFQKKMIFYDINIKGTTDFCISISLVKHSS